MRPDCFPANQASDRLDFNDFIPCFMSDRLDQEPTPPMRVIGLAGWSGAGKTTLLVRLIPALMARGLTVSTVKHAHHKFDVDSPETDTWKFREAGADEVLVASGARWVLLRELRDEPEPELPALLARMDRVDLVVIEGFKRENHPKIEVHRHANGKPPLFPDDPTIAAIASDFGFPDLAIPLRHLDDIQAIADVVEACAKPIGDIDWAGDQGLRSEET
jgi:molybdopterin-guanine dinucleotide biosynthesis protein B